MEIKYWSRADGSKIALTEMTDLYIRNSIHMLTRENTDYADLSQYKDLLEEVERRSKVQIEDVGNVKLSKALDKLYIELRKQKKATRTLENIVAEHLIEAKITGFRMACGIIIGDK